MSRSPCKFTTGVAHRTWAWIETFSQDNLGTLWQVAHRTWAWIETMAGNEDVCFVSSPTVRGRGLKPFQPETYSMRSLVAHRTWAWIETRARLMMPFMSLESPTVRGRGLKQIDVVPSERQRLSPTVRGRGLKHVLPHYIDPEPFVAHRTWAWIET